jgi:hypothetical protein
MILEDKDPVRLALYNLSLGGAGQIRIGALLTGLRRHQGQLYQ